MGHNRLPTLPDTRPWRRVVGHLADGSAVAAVARAVTEAAAAGLAKAASDAGLAHVLYLLAHTALAARRPDFATALADVGVRVPPDPSVFDLTAGLSEALQDWHRLAKQPRTDFAELAELAAGETLTRCVGERSATLIPTGGEVHAAVRALSTAAGFATLAHEFFARFARRFLHYHLDRELAQHVGGNGRFADRDARRRFAADLDTHCREAAVVVRTYAADWYSKAGFESGIDEAAARRFATTGVKKVRAELLRRGARHG